MYAGGGFPSKPNKPVDLSPIIPVQVDKDQAWNTNVSFECFT